MVHRVIYMPNYILSFLVRVLFSSPVCKEKRMAHFIRVIILVVVFGISLPTMTGAVFCNDPMTCDNRKEVTNKTNMAMTVDIYYYHGDQQGFGNNQSPGWKNIRISLYPEQTYRFGTYTRAYDPFITFTVYDKNNEKLCETQLQGIKQSFYLRESNGNFCIYDN